MAKKRPKSKGGKSKAGRPSGTGQYPILVRMYVSEEMQTEVRNWGMVNGAANFSHAVRLILAKELGVRP